MPLMSKNTEPISSFSWSSYFAAVTIAVLHLWYAVRLWKKRSSEKLSHYQQKKESIDRDVKSYRTSPAALNTKITAKLEFLTRNKERYGYLNSKKGFIDEWKPSEFPTLLPPLELQQGCAGRSIEPEVYLDYAGSALPTRSQLTRIFQQNAMSPRNSTTKDIDNSANETKNTQILANPHSLGGGIASDRTLKLIQQSTHCVMKHFGIDDEQINFEGLDTSESQDKPLFPGYRLVFTTGATESLRIVAERFPWSKVKVSSPSNDVTIKMKLNSAHIGGSFSKEVQSLQVKSILVYPRNAHTSVIGMRDAAIGLGAQFHCVPVGELLNVTSDWFRTLIEKNLQYEEHNPSSLVTAEEKKQSEPTDIDKTGVSVRNIWVHNLLVLPVECNFGGDRFDWSNTVAAARKSTFVTQITCTHPNDCDSGSIASHVRVCHKWHVLLDTAKAAATSEVNLPTVVKDGPDFAIVSFYKMFGHPTGLGALFVKKQRRQTKPRQRMQGDLSRSYQTIDHIIEIQKQRRHYFGGGSVDVVMPHVDFTIPSNSRRRSSQIEASIKAKELEEECVEFDSLVNGTQHFRGIVELMHGFRELNELGGMSEIFSHSTCLAAELVARFKSLHHENGKPVVQLYGKWKTYDHNLASPGVEHEASLTGPTVTFNVCDLDGSVIGYDEVSRIATLNQPPIQLRTGCFCNPGACQDALLLSDNDILKNYSSGHVCGDRKGIVDGRPTGCIRASFGKESLWEDMDALASFVEKTFLSQGKASIPEKSHTASSASRFKIDSMYIFPIKSCAGMKVDQWPIERDTGKLVLDREFALVDASGVAMRLSSYPQMSQIYPIVDTSTNTMVVSAPDHEKLILSLETTSGMSVSSKEIEVCGILCKGAVWGGRKASDWFTSVLGVRCWLARHEGSAKATNLKEDNKNRQPSYSNEAAILLVSQPSVDVLNSIIRTQGWGRQVDHRHFRPNIVVRAKDAGNQPKVGEHPEDLWQRILISGKTQQVELIATGKCARCQMVDIDPTSGMKGNTLKALAQYRRDRGRIYFGTFFSGVKDSNYENSEDVVRLNIGDDIESFE